jgi:hypothetical protein
MFHGEVDKPALDEGFCGIRGVLVWVLMPDKRLVLVAGAGGDHTRALAADGATNKAAPTLNAAKNRRRAQPPQ